MMKLVRQMVKVVMDFVSLVKEFGKQWYASLTEKKNVKDICTET